MMNKIKLLLFYTFLTFSFSVNSLQAQDTDGDGIANSTDLDDDNDGIPDTVECPSITNHPVYHLYDDNYISSTNFLDLYKQLNGIGSTFVCPIINCSVNPAGAL
ncbi:thrombospondin type 3 repeat-containing protein [Chryseobacterium sp. SIMBA_029]|uniref:thrombospondin type 3 repeat-containing protein n=1 Tax=Chryseobacterium sp. SIMBA_029 TaxID=3085772 RepID=UPI0039789A21